MTTKKERLRAVVYARRSMDDGPDESRSVADQVRDLTRHAEDRGWTVAEVCKDDGVSGWVWDERKRPGIFRAMELVASGEVDAVMCWWPNRLSRDDVRRELLTRECEAAGVRIYVGSTRSEIDRSTATGFVNDKFDQLLGAWQSKVISDNWKDAARRRREAGLTHGGPARFGYRRPLHDDGTAVKGAPQEPDPATGPLLRELYLRYTAGAGISTLARELNERGVPGPTGGKWVSQSLSRLLDSGFGAGLLIRDSLSGSPSFTEGAHEAVISREEWQAFRDARAARKGLAPRARSPKWYLAGLVKCGRCGASMGLAGRNAVCTRYTSGRACEGAWMKRQWVEREVNRWTLGHLEDLAGTLPERSQERERARQGLDRLTALADENKAALGRLAEGWARGVLDDAGYEAARVGLLEERARLDDEMRAARAELDLLGEPSEDPVIALAERFESAPEETPAEYGKRLGRILRRVDVYPDRLVFTPVVGRPEETGRWTRERGECQRPDCDLPHHAAGWCQKHYQQERRRDYMREYKKTYKRDRERENAARRAKRAAAE